MTEQTTITLVDAPDRIEDPEIPGLYPRENQRTYKVSDLDKTHTVKIDRNPDVSWEYRVQNLVGGTWHTLLTGSTVKTEIPFDEAAARAAAVLL